MAKWADYLISGVRYSITDKKKYISTVHVREDLDEKVPDSTMTRAEVISKIDKNYAFKTIIKKNGKWELNEDVHKLNIKHFDYLKTTSNNKEEDNLGNLPEF